MPDTTKKTVFQQLAHIQKDLKAPKNQLNKHGNYKYRSCEDILEAVKPLLGDCIIMITDKIVRKGDRYYVKAVAQITDGKDKIENEAWAREVLDRKGMDASQITGATSSYARKYALNGLFAIDDNKDADSQDNAPENGTGKPGPQPTPTTTTPPGPRPCTTYQIKDIFKLGEDLGHDRPKVIKIVTEHFRTDSINSLSLDQASKAIAGLKKKLAETEDEFEVPDDL